MNSPGQLVRVWTWWKRVAHAIGNFQARVILTVFYFVVVPPFALVLRLSKDPLGLRTPSGGAHWTDRPESDSSRAASQQF